MQWENEPRAWQVDGNRITVTTQPKSDFWRKTLHEFIAESGHLLKRWQATSRAAVTFVGNMRRSRPGRSHGARGCAALDEVRH
ncbi:MAG: DUF1349 domain-containing protein [Caldilineaceae bacterium]